MKERVPELTSFTPDGRRLAYTAREGNGRRIAFLPIEEHGGALRVRSATPHSDHDMYGDRAAISPDGRWLAYASVEHDASEVYVRPLAGEGNAQWQVSRGGGGFPVWSRTKPELFFEGADGRIMVAAYDARGDSFEAAEPRAWSQTRLSAGFFAPREFDVAPDGTRVAVSENDLVSGVAARPPLHHVIFVLNVFDELQRRMAPSR